MSRYGDSDYDDMFYELDEFLNSHKPSELLKLVQDAVEWWEEKDDERFNQPSAQPERKGKWIYLDGLDVFECSVCGRQMVRNIFNYCPWCGARMEGEDDDE